MGTHNRLRDFQYDGVKLIKQVFSLGVKRKFCFLADEPGLGKTAQAIEISKHIEGRLLIVCPASLKHNWLNELLMWGVEEKDISLIPTKIVAKARYVIINYDLLSRYEERILSVKWGMVIFDEAHYLKTPTAARTKSAAKICGASSAVLAITGTPIVNQPMDILNLMHLFLPGFWFDATAKNMWQVYHRYYLTRQFDIGGAKTRTHFYAPRESMMPVIAKKIAPYIVRRTKQEVLTELPDKIKQIIEIDAESTREMILEAEQFEQQVVKLGRYKAITDIHLSTLRQEVAMKKISAVVDLAEQVLAEEGKVVIFCVHHAIIDALQEEFRNRPNHYRGSNSEVHPQIMVIDGRVPVAARETIVGGFQMAKRKILIAQIQTAGVGLTLTTAKTVIFAEWSYVPGEIDQAIDRLHRIGQKDSVRAIFIAMRNSVDKKILEILLSKQKDVDKLLQSAIS